MRVRVVSRSRLVATVLSLSWALVASGCGGGSKRANTWKCEIAAGATTPDYLQRIGCAADFEAVSSQPLDTSIPGARSAKVVFDRLDGGLYFQNSNTYPIHHEFAARHLSAPAHPPVPSLSEFNRTEYSSLDRRFILGAVAYYGGPRIWALELAPYDTASRDMIEKLFDAVKDEAFFGSELAFHPTSDAIATVAETLPAGVPIKTTDQIFAGIDYQPLNLGTAMGRLRFVTAAGLASGYLDFRDIVVLDHVPNDISVVVGMITQDFQTPLAHINVLAQNRRMPNMGLRAATTNATLQALDGKWVSLTVGAFDWSVREVTQYEADAWWAGHKPAPVQVPEMDLSETALKNVEDLVDESGLPANRVGLRERIGKAISAYGGKAANYSILAKTEYVPVRKAFAIPVFYYDQFMRDNGFYARVDALLADARFQNDPAVRDAQLARLRADMEAAPVDAVFSALLRAKLQAEYPGLTMRFRTSTNAEDQEDFLCAGCYDSHTGQPADVLPAIRKTWAGVWYFRTFEERAYHGIDHKKIGMALLVHHNFAAEEANGVAVTANIFDPTGLEPGYYVNVQWGGQAEVVAPPPGITSDEILVYYRGGSTSTTYLNHSNLVPDGTTVLAPAQILDLAAALEAIAKRFAPAYGPLAGNTGFYALEVDFKFDDEDHPQLPPRLFVKQARNYRGRGNQ